MTDIDYWILMFDICILTGNEECGMSNITACKNQQAAFNPSLPTPWTDEHYDEFCRKADLFGSCVNKLSCTSSDSHYVDYQKLVGVAIGDEYLCSAAARPVFLANQACLTTKLQLITWFCDRISYPSNVHILAPSYQCRLDGSYYNCMHKGMEYCSQEFANAIVEFYTRKHTPTRVATINCNLTKQIGTIDTVSRPCNRPTCGCSSAGCQNLIPQSVDFATADIDEICQQVEEFGACLARLDCPHAVQNLHREQLVGVINGYHYMCAEDVKPAIEDNQACIASAVSSLPSVTDIVVNSNDVCRTYEDYALDVFKSVNSTCNNEEVATIVTTLFMRRLSSFLHTSFWCHLGYHTQCGVIEIFKCMSEQDSFSPSFPTLWTAADYDSFCSKAEKLKSCFNAITCFADLSPLAFYQMYFSVVGINDGYEYICYDSTRPVIQTNQACLAANLSSIVASCRRAYPVNDALVSHSAITEQCKNRNSQNKCVYEALKTHCNEDIGTAVVLFYIKTDQPRLLDTIKCQLDKSYLATASPSSTVSIVQSLIGVLVYLMYYD